uniref:Ubiquitinyl hydrolase 1 n=1 Tax=Timema cristinae TaxID=61476 RepID=A0A7R9D245_TIMCR|nr:unnamed protein product [Timema cristinae]
MAGKKKKNRHQQEPGAQNGGESTESCEENQVSSTVSCPHAAKAVDLQKVKKALKFSNGISRECTECAKSKEPTPPGEDDSSPALLWMCLKCGNQACGRSHRQHALKHHATPHSESHDLVLSTDMWNVCNGISRECTECAKSKEPTPPGEDDSSPALLWMCLKCGNQACGRSHRQHALKHHATPHSESHDLVLSTDMWNVWCYSCDKELSPSCKKKLLECVEFLKKQEMATFVTSKRKNGLAVCEVEVKEKEDQGDLKNVMSTNRSASSSSRNKTSPTSNLPRLRGLCNLGNTCFFNAVLQCLARTPFLLPVLQELNKPGQKFTLPGTDELPPLEGTLAKWGSLTEILASTLEELSSNKSEVLNPHKLLAKVTQRCPQFAGGDQHDSHELLRHLLEGVRTEDLKRYQTIILHTLGLSEKCNPSQVEKDLCNKVKVYGRQAAEQLLVPEQVFRGYLVSTVECQDCLHTSNRVESFLDLSLPVIADKPQPPVMRRKGSTKECAGELFEGATTGGQQPSKYQVKKDRKQARKGRKKQQKGFSPLEDTTAETVISEEGDARPPDESEQSDADIEDNLDQDSKPSQEVSESGYSSEKLGNEDSTLESPVPNEDSLLSSPVCLGTMPSSQSKDHPPSLDLYRQNKEPLPSLDFYGLNKDPLLPLNIYHQSKDPLYPLNILSPEQGSPLPPQHSSPEQGSPLPPQHSSPEQGSPLPPQHLSPEQRTPSSPQPLLPEQGSPFFPKPLSPVHRTPHPLQPLSPEQVSPSSLQPFSTRGPDDMPTCTPLGVFHSSSPGSSELNVDCASPGSLLGHGSASPLSAGDSDRPISRMAFCSERGPRHTSPEHFAQDLSQLCISAENLIALEWYTSSTDYPETFVKGSEADSFEETTIGTNATPSPGGDCGWGSTLAHRYQLDGDQCTVQSCLNQFTALELMTGSNKVGCENCSQRHNHGKEGKMVYTNSTKQLLVSWPPGVLILHLKRFQVFRSMFRKISCQVNFPLVLDIAPICSSKAARKLQVLERLDKDESVQKMSLELGDCPTIRPGQTQVLYSLYGVVEHSGGLHGGHYVAYVKVRAPITPDDPRWSFLPPNLNGLNNIVQLGQDAELPEPPAGRWFHVSDSRVNEVSEERVLKSPAYLLFYERIY